MRSLIVPRIACCGRPPPLPSAPPRRRWLPWRPCRRHMAILSMAVRTLSLIPQASRGAGPLASVWPAAAAGAAAAAAVGPGGAAGAAAAEACRRLAGTGPPPLEEHDRIVLKGLVFHGHHGALPEENVLGQKFVVDAVLWADLAAAGRSDELGDTVDYAVAYREIQRVVEGPPRALQEAVAEDVCERLLRLSPRVAAVRLYIRKPHVALPGVLESVGVEVLRRRRGGGAA